MSRDNAEMMEAAYAAITAGDLDAFLALAHPSIEFNSLIAEADGGAFKGHAGVREWWDQVIVSLDVRPNPEQIESFRDRGITRLQLAGTVEGVQVPQEMWMAWRVRDGLLAWWTTYRTEREALEAVGLSE
jgi:ketosteroid isomerase-like protein